MKEPRGGRGPTHQLWRMKRIKKAADAGDASDAEKGELEAAAMEVGETTEEEVAE